MVIKCYICSSWESIKVTSSQARSLNYKERSFIQGLTEVDVQKYELQNVFEEVLSVLCYSWSLFFLF